MALVKRNDKPQTFSWNVRDSRKTQHKLPVIKNPPVIDYDKLQELCSIDGMKNRDNNETSEEAHREFMANYHKMFVKPPKKLGFPIHTEKRGENRGSTLSVSHKATGSESHEKKPIKKQLKTHVESHNVSDYLPLLHKERKSEDPVAIRAANIRTLRRILRKLPFERTAVDNDRVFSILRTFPFFAQCVPLNVLKELCVVAQLEIWKEDNFTIFGNSGLHMVLKGSVLPLTSPYLNIHFSQMEFRSPTPIEDEVDEKLEVGECFGTLVKIEDRSANTKVLSVNTDETPVELLKISVSDYNRVIEQIRQREHTEKLNVLLSGDQYGVWPRQPLIQVANLIEWMTYPPNTVVVSEGYKSPFIGFIKSGECHVLRQVEVLHTLHNGQKERKTKQVVMGRLKPSDSFAELSVLLDEPITCSIVTATDIELGIIKPERIEELDEVTIQLFKQSNTRTFGDLTKEDIQEEYIQQELKREWNEFKHSVVVDVINSRGIRPGYGRWTK
ncbi:cyclic nucleotide-binding domain-containing protein 1-like [Haliotis rufescens]|uniref:cyclic nucleotide-binding domain-containing protein 1-like n=1 Tax=Haliotis rufescens TaxID=6454 RepID=UPI001EB02CA6|nr:cyclic nucleotide-binding domain-containing protein 1-like [Haliotis rufescens]